MPTGSERGVQLQEVAQKCVQFNFKYLQGQTFHNMFSCFVIFNVKMCFLRFKKVFLYFSLCQLSLLLSLGATNKSLDLPSYFPFRYFLHSSDPPQPSLLQIEQSQFFQALLIYKTEWNNLPVERDLQ